MTSILNSLKLLADPTRLRILLLLESEALSVAELQEILGMGQSRISTQLSSLRRENLVKDQRSGKNNIYRSTLPPALRTLVTSTAAELEDADKDQGALAFVLQKRQDHMRQYFDDLAGKFGRNYVPGRSWKALSEALLRILNYKVVVDLGAGEGTLSQLLAQRADQVIAVDHSEKMVAFGQNLAAQHGLDNLEYRYGDLEDVPVAAGEADLAIFSQALHHARHPDRALAEAARILKPGGCLVVLDLLQHNFEKARDLYFDTWLGFPEHELRAMVQAAGFEHVESLIADKESASPYFQTLLVTGWKSPS